MPSFCSPISARNVAVIAFVCWLASLTLTGFALGDGGRHMPGYEILLTGWLSPLVLNFAWFANLFFLYGIFNLFSGKVPATASIFAAFLSFDTVRFDRLLLNEGGGSTPVYGYGWGAILWFLAIFLMMFATETRQQEINAGEKSQNSHSKCSLIGLPLLVLLIVVTTVLTLHDKAIANQDEAERLAHIAFKRGKVCGVVKPMEIQPIRNWSAPFEVVIKMGISEQFPFLRVENLLAWGIPTVRVEGFDYTFDPVSHDGSLQATPAIGSPAATLYIDEKNFLISAKLVETRSGRTVFEQHWDQLPKNPLSYCQVSELEKKPTKIFKQALDIHATTPGAPVIAPNGASLALNQVNGKIIRQSDNGLTRIQKYKNWKEKYPDGGSQPPYHERSNINCPEDIGWNLTNYKGYTLLLDAGVPFMLKGVAHYLPHWKQYNATCEGAAAYIYQVFSEEGEYALSIEKRDLGDFRPIWGKLISLSDIPSLDSDDLKVHSVKESPDKEVTLELVDENSGHVFVVRALLDAKKIP